MFLLLEISVFKSNILASTIQGIRFGMVDRFAHYQLVHVVVLSRFLTPPKLKMALWHVSRGGSGCPLHLRSTNLKLNLSLIYIFRKLFLSILCIMCFSFANICTLNILNLSGCPWWCTKYTTQVDPIITLINVAVLTLLAKNLGSPFSNRCPSVWSIIYKHETFKIRLKNELCLLTKTSHKTTDIKNRKLDCIKGF